MCILRWCKERVDHSTIKRVDWNGYDLVFFLCALKRPGLAAARVNNICVGLFLGAPRW